MNDNWEERLRKLTHNELLVIAKEFSIRSTVFNNFIPKSADGVMIKDWNGRTYLDFTSGVGCNNLGYGNPRVTKAIIQQVIKGILNFPDNDWYNPWATLLKKKLCEITPGEFPKKVFLSNSGSEAIEAAVKILLKNRPRKKKFFSFKGAFHGRTGYALALNASKPIHTQHFPLALETYKLNFPEQNSFNDFEGCLRAFDFREFNAVFVELVQGEGGINVADQRDIVKTLNFLKTNDVKVVVDEVQTGMMRTGKMFACEHYGIEPDIICLGKGLASGMPIGATVAKAELDFPESGCHSNTFGGNAVSSAAALETIELLEELDMKKFEHNVKIFDSFGCGGLGMMRKMVCRDGIQRDLIMDLALGNGLILLGAGACNIRLTPPLIIEPEELLDGLKILQKIKTIIK